MGARWEPCLLKRRLVHILNGGTNSAVSEPVEGVLRLGRGPNVQKGEWDPLMLQLVWTWLFDAWTCLRLLERTYSRQTNKATMTSNNANNSKTRELL